MRQALGLFAVLCAAAPAGAVDYDKVPRKVVKEPAYKAKAPGYALLLFGREARLRVWVVVDGERLYLDRNGDGDLTGKDEAFAKAEDCKGVELADPDGKTRYVITSVGVYKDEKEARTSVMVNVDVKGPVEYRQYCDAEVRASPAKAALAHFHGPLTAGPVTRSWKVPPQLKLYGGGGEQDLRSLVGTMSEKHGCWVVVRSDNGKKSAFAEGVCPVVEVAYPAKKGGEPLVRRYSLDKFC